MKIIRIHFVCPQPPALPYLVLLSLVLVTGFAWGTAAAEPPVTVENVRLGIQDTFKAGSWTAVRVDLQGGPEPFEGTLEVQAPDSDGTPTRVRQPVALGSRQQARFVVYIRPGSIDGDDVVARVRNRRGRPQGPDVHARARDGNAPLGLDEKQLLIVTLGHPAGVAEVAGLGAYSGNGANAPLKVVAADPAELPGRWYGLDAVSVLVLDANDPDALEAVRTHIEIVRQWVRNGGHLVVAGAARGQEVKQLLDDLLPAVPNGTTRLNDLGEIESFAGAKNSPIPGSAMTVAILEEADARGGRTLSTSTTTPLLVRGAYGFGRVTISGLNVDQKPFSDWKDKKLYWARALDLKAAVPDESLTAAAVSGAPAREVGDLANLLHNALDRPPGVTAVPFGWVAFFVFVYILLIGPGDYLFLKHIVKRMELTWLTFPLIVIVTSVLAYAAAYSLKGTDLKVMKVDAIDLDQNSGRVRGTTWLTLFSPRNHDYDVSLAPMPLTGAQASRTLGVERLVSWFGPPDTTFGGGRGTNRMGGLGDLAYAYAPEGQAEMLGGVRVPIWSTKSFTARWSAPLPEPLLDASLAPAGYDRLEGTISNRSDRPLHAAVLIHGNQVYDQLGTIAPGATVTIDLASRTRPLSGYLEERARGLKALGPHPQPRPDDPRPTGSLADLIRVMMFRDGMNPKTDTAPSIPLHDLDLTGQLDLGRPMLLANLDIPGTELLLGRPPSPPQVEQTTVVRVILSLSSPAP